MLLYHCVSVPRSQIDRTEVVREQVLGALQRRALIEVLPMPEIAHDLARGAQHNRFPVTPRLLIADGFRCAVFERGGPHIQAVDSIDVDPIDCRAQLEVAGQDQRRKVVRGVAALHVSLSGLLASPLVLGSTWLFPLSVNCG